VAIGRSNRSSLVLFSLYLVLGWHATNAAPRPGADLGLVPRPAELELREGSWVLTERTRVVAGETAVEEGRKLAEALSDALGRPITLARGRAGRDDLALMLDTSRAELTEEGYELLVSPAGVRMTATTPAGLFYAGQTFRQLLPPVAWRRAPAAGADWRVQAVRILDRPRFSWRGLLLDPARHFIPKAALLEIVDAMAMHKMNRLQLHLTDDQGWRIEIRSFPRLTARSSWRAGTLLGNLRDEPHRFSSVPHGGFYSQDDLREIVAYAKARHIVIVPEIEMPGHARAWLSAYPEFAVFPEAAADMELWKRWGVSKDVLAPRPATLEACRRILDEVCELFPSPWIHTGGDEAPRDQWNESAEIQGLIKSLGLENADQLQAWFTAELSRYLAVKGRRLVGWDEILAGADLGSPGAKTVLHPSAIVHSWRGEEGGLAAAKAGHDVIMSPHQWTYLDYYQGPPTEEPLAIGGSISLAKTYTYEPVPAALPETASARVLGGQTQVWGEYLPGFEAVAYMAFPRASALAEVFWSPREGKDLSDFLIRLAGHEKRLQAAGIHHRPLARRTSWPQASGRVAGSPEDAVIHGTEITRREDGALAGWKNEETLISWRVQLPTAGRYRLRLAVDPSSPVNGSVEAIIAGAVLQGKDRQPGHIDLGTFHVPASGPYLLFLKATPGSLDLPVIQGVELEPDSGQSG
jgi:hexosaminidase